MALIKCPNCGADISDKAYKCPKCGYEIGSLLEPQQNNDNVAKRNNTIKGNDTIVLSKNSLIKIVTIAVVFIGLLAGVAFFAYHSGVSSSKTDSEETILEGVHDEVKEDFEVTTKAKNDEKSELLVEERDRVDTEQNEQITESEVDNSATEETSAVIETTSSSQVDTNDIALGKKNALEKAQTALKYTAYSYEGLIDYLKYEKFTDEEAKYGADNCGGNWKELAVKRGQTALKYTAYSYEGLIDYLKYEKFTDEEAKYGADNSEGNWKELAVKRGQTALKYTAYSYEGLIDYLKYEKFTDEEAKYGADNCGGNWKELSVKRAQTALKYTAYSYEGLIDYLKYEKFTDEEAKYGADNCGEKWN